MRIDILCLFPETFASPLNQSIIKRAREQALVDIVIHDIRDYTHDKHHTADDYPYGGSVVIKERNHKLRKDTTENWEGWAKAFHSQSPNSFIILCH